MHVLYLHGFASSAQSGKAAFLAERFRSHGVTLQCPDLNAPDFSTLTVTRMIAQVQERIDALRVGPVALIGSSLGGFVAWHAAVRRASVTDGTEARGAARGGGGPLATRLAGYGGPHHPIIDRLVLLAPALDFGANRLRDLGEDGMEAWRRTNALDVYHYGYGETRSVHYALFTDAQEYDSFATTLEVPTLIIQGRRDEAVDPEMVERFARGHRNVALRLVDDGHQLLESLELVWKEIEAFLLRRG